MDGKRRKVGREVRVVESLIHSDDLCFLNSFRHNGSALGDSDLLGSLSELYAHGRWVADCYLEVLVWVLVPLRPCAERASPRW